MSPSRLPVFDYDQVLPLGFQFPARMTLLPLEAGQVALVSPIPIDDTLARSIAELGEVAFLIAPNLLHHLYLDAAIQRYPQARVVAPSRLREKKPNLHIHAPLDFTLDPASLERTIPPELAAAVDVVALQGTPAMDELVFFHRATRTLVVTDLVFHVTEPRGWMAHLTFFVVGCYRRLAASRVQRLVIKDRTAARASVDRILALPFERLVMAHGEGIEHDAHPRLEQAMAWLKP